MKGAQRQEARPGTPDQRMDMREETQHSKPVEPQYPDPNDALYKFRKPFKENRPVRCSA